MKDRKIEFRQTFLSNVPCLQVRICAPENVNWLYKAVYRFIHPWNYLFIRTCDPSKFEEGEEELAYNFLQCGKYGLPDFKWFCDNIHTINELDEFIDVTETRLMNDE